ncbi:hypothetical protein [Sulfurospirillum multivorans]|uniref:Uncharacterized protein n=2 Tax=Sulfurospirillum multivorans TaxID=66821 RepID=A0AA86AN08_SULMK|nr:hypothetical protein [Sulfurospirillum multivorans]AHJ12431.1 hypothetical protein SMUL_1166 [Sulfurospirillum multivorans DSM 12446]QEH05928.1 hypothetical protein SMN_1155 [Sulfurospirillum multivorans]
MQDNSTKVYPHFVQQAYQADVLLRRVLLSSVGTRYPHKDQVVITAENTYQHPTNAIYSFSHRIDVVVKCENRIEAVKLNQAIREYLSKDMMLPLHVGVFQKPFTKDNQKARKYFAYSNTNAKELLETLPKLEKDKSLKFVLGSSPIESNVLANGFDLTYSISDFDLEHTIFTIEDAKKSKTEITKDIYKVTLYTSTIFEVDADTIEEVLINFEINGESASELDILANKLTELKNNGIVFTCKGQFPRAERDFYRVSLSKTAGELIAQLSTTIKPESQPKVS